MTFPATIFLLIVLISPTHLAADPWVHERGEQSFSVFFVAENFDDIWIKGDDVNMDFADVDQTTLFLQYTRGLTELITLELSTGLTRSKMKTNDKKYDGLTDSTVGINWQLLNEYHGSPVTLSVSFAATLKGTYDRSSAGQPHSPGDKADALEASVNLAKALGHRLVLVVDIGYRDRYNGVPDDIFYSLGLTGNVLPSLILGARYRVVDSRGNLDIGGPGFTPDFFHETEEDIDSFSIDATWSFGYGHSVNLGFATVIKGTNTGNSDIYFLGDSYNF